MFRTRVPAVRSQTSVLGQVASRRWFFTDAAISLAWIVAVAVKPQAFFADTRAFLSKASLVTLASQAFLKGRLVLGTEWTLEALISSPSSVTRRTLEVLLQLLATHIAVFALLYTFIVLLGGVPTDSGRVATFLCSILSPSLWKYLVDAPVLRPRHLFPTAIAILTFQLPLVMLVTDNFLADHVYPGTAVLSSLGGFLVGSVGLALLAQPSHEIETQKTQATEEKIDPPPDETKSARFRREAASALAKISGNSKNNETLKNR